MACNCATQEELDRLYKIYGDKKKKPQNAKIGDYFKYYIENGLVYLCGLIVFPFLVLYIFALLFWREDGKIHIGDINILRKLKIIK